MLEKFSNLPDTNKTEGVDILNQLNVYSVLNDAFVKLNLLGSVDHSQWIRQTKQKFEQVFQSAKTFAEFAKKCEENNELRAVLNSMNSEFFPNKSEEFLERYYQQVQSGNIKLVPNSQPKGVKPVPSYPNIPAAA